MMGAMHHAHAEHGHRHALLLLWENSPAGWPERWAAMAPPPAPCRMRKNTSKARLGASPQSMELIVKMATQVM